jgi:hypothetical protein
MGHIHLGVLPKTLPWKRVVSLLDEGAADHEVVAESARAAERELTSAARDPVYVEAVRILLTIPLCARTDDFGAALRRADILAPNRPELLDLIEAATQRLDQVRLGNSGRSDLGEIAGRALISTLSVGIGDQLPGLFAATPDDVQSVARKLSWSKGISAWTRLFYSRLVSGSLSYWLDRTLAEQIGPDRRFAGVSQRDEFDTAVNAYSIEATRIIQEFSGGWYGKTIHQNGTIDTENATLFGAVALKKIVAELRVKRGDDV